jgi:hypothetical protein
MALKPGDITISPGFAHLNTPLSAAKTPHYQPLATRSEVATPNPKGPTNSFVTTRPLNACYTAKTPGRSF